MRKDQNFRKHVEKHFKLDLPQGIEIFFFNGIRVGNSRIRSSKIAGDRGYAASDMGFNPTNSFIQNFGHLAKKNIVRLKNAEAVKFAAGSDLGMDLGVKPKNVIVTYRGYVLGLGYYENGTIRNRIPEKRRRIIENSDGL